MWNTICFITNRRSVIKRRKPTGRKTLPTCRRKINISVPREKFFPINSQKMPSATTGITQPGGFMNAWTVPVVPWNQTAQSQNTTAGYILALSCWKWGKRLGSCSLLLKEWKCGLRDRLKWKLFTAGWNIIGGFGGFIWGELKKWKLSGVCSILLTISPKWPFNSGHFFSSFWKHILFPQISSIILKRGCLFRQPLLFLEFRTGYY